MPDALDLADEFAAFDADDFEPRPDEPPIVVEDADTVNRLLRRRGALVARVAQVRTWVDAEQERLARFADDRTAGLLKSIAWFERSLENWMRDHHERTGDKTMKLPNGTVQLRAASKRVDVARPTPSWFPSTWETALAEFGRFVWLAQSGLVRFTWGVDRTAVAKYCGAGPVEHVDEDGYEYRTALDADGVVLPGVRIVTRDRSNFSIPKTNTTSQEGP